MVDLLAGAQNVSFDLEPTIHEINVVSSLSEALSTSTASAVGLDPDKLFVAALDSACNRSCAGAEWLAHMKDALEKAPEPIRSLVAEKPCRDYFRFGNGGVLESLRRLRIPVLVQNQVVLLWLAEMPCASLGCLLGKDFLESLGATLDFPSKKVQLRYVSDGWIPLSKMRAGHFSMNLLPKPLSSWPTLTSQSWHVVGVGGCCEVQCEGRVSWKARNRLVDLSSDADGDLNMVVHYIPEFFSSSKAWMPVEDAAQPVRRPHPGGVAMAAPPTSTAGEENMALEGRDALAGSTTFPSLHAGAFASGDDFGGVESSAEGHW